MVCLCLCVWRGLSPKASQAPSGSPGISSSLQALGFPGLSPAGCWGSPWIPQHRSSNPRALPAAPSPRSDPRRAACPFKSGPADITAGGGGLARLPAPRRLQDPAPLCARLLLWGPRPGTPPPASSSRPDPRLRPRPGQSPSPYQGSPRIAPALSPSQGLSLPLSLCLSLSLAQGVWVSASLSPGPVSVSLSLCLSLTCSLPEPQKL